MCYFTVPFCKVIRSPYITPVLSKLPVDLINFIYPFSLRIVLMKLHLQWPNLASVNKLQTLEHIAVGTLAKISPKVFRGGLPLSFSASEIWTSLEGSLPCTF